MKIFILTPQLPYPPQQGTSLRNFHIIRGLAERHEVTLLSFLEEGQTAVHAQVGPLAELCQRIEMVPLRPRSRNQRLRQFLFTRQPDMAQRLASQPFIARLQQVLAGEPFDVVQIEGIELAHTLETIRVANGEAKVVFDAHNAETELQRRNMLADLGRPRRWPAALYSWVQVRRLARFERWVCEEADWVTAVSETDKHHLQAHHFQSPISVIPNCIDIQNYEEQARTEERPGFSHDLVFSGKMDYRPNVDAVLWFAEAVWPGIKAVRPSTTWAIVGQKPHPRLNHLRRLEGVTVTGWVEDIRPYLAGGRVFIMPFRVGSGTRLKLIEALAAGKAIVSTAIGAEGFPVANGRDLLLANSATEMTTAVLRLLEDPQERTRLGAAARQFARNYDWRVVMPQFETIYQQLLVT